MSNKYDKSEGVTSAQAAKLLGCKVEDLSKYKLTKLQIAAPQLRHPTQKTYFYLRSEVLDLLN